MASVVDRLALDRTRLANERTMLAYLRTALGFGAAGATLLRLFPENATDQVLGAGLLAFGGATVAFGTWRCATEHLRYRRMEAEMR